MNARLDTYSLRLGSDVVQWMCNELQQADRVLLICDERYAKRADGRHGGVGWETMLVQGDLFASLYGSESEGVDAPKYIPIVVTPNLDDGRPKYLATKLALHWPPRANEEECRQALLRELFYENREIPVRPRIH